MENSRATIDEVMGFLQENMVTKTEFGELDSKVQNLEVKINDVKLDVLDAMDDKLANLKADLQPFPQS